jgi:hypothetical protein
MKIFNIKYFAQFISISTKSDNISKEDWIILDSDVMNIAILWKLSLSSSKASFELNTAILSLIITSKDVWEPALV